MHNDAHPLLAPAKALVRIAEQLHEEVARGDVVMAHGYSILALSRMSELQAKLDEELRRRAGPEWADHDRVNPYRDVRLHGSTTKEAVHRLGDEDLLEHCRATNWSLEHHPQPVAARWLRAHLTVLEDELRVRGIVELAWRDGRERS